MSYQQTSAAEDPMAIWYIVGAICLLFAIIIWRFLPEIVFASCLILHTLWGMIDWGPFHNFAVPRYNLLAITANNAATITFSQWLDVMSRTVGILWLILLPIDRKSTRLNSITNSYLVCRLLLEKKKKTKK